MKITNTKKYFWIFLCLAILVVTAFGFLVYLIHTNKIKVQILKTKIYSEEKQVKNIDSLKKLTLSIAENRQRITNLFISSQNTVSFLEYLESLGRLSGADVEIISVGEEEVKKTKKKDDDNNKKEQFSRVKVRFSGEGTWGEVYKMVGFVSNLPYSIQISGMDLSTDEDSRYWKVVFEILVDKI